MSRIQLLADYLRLLREGPVTKEVFRAYEPVLSSADAREVNDTIDTVLEGALAQAPALESDPIEAWKVPVARFIRSVSKSLDARPLPGYPRHSLLESLDAENSAIEDGLSSIRSLIPQPFDPGDPGARNAVRARAGRFTILKDHYRRLQNELFPLFEQASPHHRCVSLMWAIQDDVLELQALLADPSLPAAEFPGIMGRFFVTAGMLAYRERRVLYPVAYGAIGRDLPGRPAAAALAPSVATVTAAPGVSSSGTVFSSATGSLDAGEIDAIFKALPVDISFIDANDRVKFYSDPPHRIFPRAPAVIGRLVQNCHPPKSLAAVEEILRSFKSGERDAAEFWLDTAGAFIHISYIALRDGEGRYLGTLEVSQDATRLRALSGERRLPEWR